MSRPIERFLGICCAAGGAGLLLWWSSMGAFLPIAESANNWDAMVTHPNWVPVNLLGLAAVIALALGLPGIFIRGARGRGVLGFTGLILAEIGAMLFAAIQYYETFIWPVAGRLHPDLVQIKGPLVFGDTLVIAPLIASGAFLGLGCILLGIALIRSRVFPRFACWMLLFGAPIFANGVLFPIRSLGLLPFAAATIWMGVLLARSEASKG